MYDESYTKEHNNFGAKCFDESRVFKWVRDVDTGYYGYITKKENVVIWKVASNEIYIYSKDGKERCFGSIYKDILTGQERELFLKELPSILGEFEV